MVVHHSRDFNVGDIMTITIAGIAYRNN